VKRLLLDLNVVLDVLLDRLPHSEAGLSLWAAALRAEIEVLFPAHGVATVFYLARRQGLPFARKVVAELLAVAGICAVDEATLRRALLLEWPDLEDAVCAAAAEAASCDIIVTRDPKGYPGSPVLAVDPVTARSMLGGRPGPGQVADRPSAGQPSSQRKSRARTHRR
jgi:predicted nucleic acid-binding protein